MAVTQFLGSRFQSLKDDGTVNASGTVEFFATGGTFSTYVSSYSDSACTVPNSNVVTLNAAGAADVWVNQQVDVRVKDSSGTIVDTFLNWNPTSSSTSSSTAYNSILNGSFEDGVDSSGDPLSWDITLYTGGSRTVDTASHGHGLTSLKFTSIGTGGGYVQSEAFFPVAASEVYELSWRMKSSAANVRNLVQIYWFKADQTASTTASVDAYDDSTTNPTSWTVKTYNATAPSDAYYAKVRFVGCHNSNATSGNTAYDDIQLLQAKVYGNRTFNGTIIAAGSPIAKDLINGICEGRLTLTSGTAVTTSDVTAAETVYFTPYKGNRVAVYNGTNWELTSFTELSIDIPDATQMNDVFIYSNSGTLTLEITAWTNDTTRATALTLQDGVYVKTGATTRRYLGSFYSTTAGNGQTEDSVANRYVWNYYNRVERHMLVKESTDTWNYTTAAFRQANGSTSNQLNFCIGVSEDKVVAQVLGMGRNGSGNVVWTVAIGLDSTSAMHANSINQPGESAAANVMVPTSSVWRGLPGIGKHYLAWLEYSAATGTTTWIGDGGATYLQAGIGGYILG